MKTVAYEAGESVELIAGPMCGMMVRWPFPDIEADLKSAQGRVRYRLEKESMKGNQTAIFVQR